MLPKKVRCRETADAGAHHSQIVNFVSVSGCGSGLPECAIAKTMGRFKRANMASAKARQRGRVIARLAGLSKIYCLPARLSSRKEGPANDYRRPIDEIAARNKSIHSQVAVVLLAHE